MQRSVQPSQQFLERGRVALLDESNQHALILFVIHQADSKRFEANRRAVCICQLRAPESAKVFGAPPLFDADLPRRISGVSHW